MHSSIYQQSLTAAWTARTSAGGRQRAASAAAASGTRGTPVVASSLLLPAQTLGEAKLLYATAGAPAHDYPGHAECAERIPAILRALQAGGLTEEARPGQASWRPAHCPLACCMPVWSVVAGTNCSRVPPLPCRVPRFAKCCC